MTLASQIYPNNTKFLVSAYKQATLRPHGYLIINLTQNVADSERVMTGIFPPEFPCHFIPRD
jgi:hypothetical protein